MRRRRPLPPRPTVVCTGWKDVDGTRIHLDTVVLFQSDDPGPVSHGICPTCLAIFRAQLDERIARGREAFRRATSC